MQLRVSLTLRRIHSLGSDADNDCADHAAALGALGLVSNHNIVERWPLPRFDTVNLLSNCNDLPKLDIVCATLVCERTSSYQALYHESFHFCYPLVINIFRSCVGACDMVVAVCSNILCSSHRFSRQRCVCLDHPGHGNSSTCLCTFVSSGLMMMSTTSGTSSLAYSAIVGLVCCVNTRGVSSVRSFGSEQAQRKKRALEIQPFGNCWIETMI